MTAKEAAKHADEHPNCTQKEIEAMIPKYAHALPRRAWISTFIKNIQPLDHRFTNLK
jgi:hypothetical protein